MTADASLTLEGTRGVVDARRSAHVRLASVGTVLDALGAAAMFFTPSLVAEALGDPSGAARSWIILGGMLLLAVVLHQLQGLVNPLYARWPNLAGIANRALLAIALLIIGGRFVWLGALEAAIAVALAWTYLRAQLAERMTRP